MTPSSEQFLNPIERVVGEIAAAQEIIKQKKLLIMGLKLEIDQHYQENNFKDGDIIEGIRVEKITRSNGYEYKPAIINKINVIWTGYANYLINKIGFSVCLSVHNTK